MAWYPFCALDPPPCPPCDPDDPDNSLSVTIAGVVNYDCDCSEINATHILQRSPYDACFWEKVAYITDCEKTGWGLGSYGIRLKAEYYLVNKTQWSGYIWWNYASAYWMVHYFRHQFGTPTMDCTATQVLAHLMSGGGSSVRPCDYTVPSLFQVN